MCDRDAGCTAEHHLHRLPRASWLASSPPLLSSFSSSALISINKFDSKPILQVPTLPPASATVFHRVLSVPPPKPSLVAAAFASLLLQSPCEDISRLIAPSPSAASEAASPPSSFTDHGGASHGSTKSCITKRVPSTTPLWHTRALSCHRMALSLLDATCHDRSMVPVLCFLGVRK